MRIGWVQVAQDLVDQQTASSVWRVSDRAWLLAIWVCMAVILSKVFFMQVVTGGASMVWSEGNRLEVRRLTAARGVIEDRNGVILARNSVASEAGIVREYPQNELYVHAIGMVGQLSEKEYAECDDLGGCYLGMSVGKSGLEKYYQTDLAGVDGDEIVEVDARGNVQRVVAKRESVAGKTVRTNLDVALGKKIVSVLEQREEEKKERLKAVVVVSRVDNGQIEALVSWPGYDNNVFTAEDKSRLSQLLGDEKYKPMFNRASGGVYPPGSVYKLVTLLAGLEEKVVDGNTRIEDTGEIKIGDYRFGSWNFDQYGRKEGEMDVISGLARSNDIFFYKVGEWLGEEKLLSWSRKLGLGVKTGIDVSGEVAGTVPDPLERERRLGERWFLGNTYHLAIGQGDLLTTPLQINRMTAAVVSGKKCEPRLVGLGQKCEELRTGLDNRNVILEGMKAVCRTGGTAFEFFDSRVLVACKTGTAQQGGKEDKPHAWVTLVIPRPDTGEDIESYEKGLVVTVLVEEAGEGSYEAAPIARSILDYVMSEEGLDLF